MRILLCLLACFAYSGAAATPPRVAIILDDIGYRHSADHRALDLPPEIAFAVIPGSEHGRILGATAVQQGREVLIHLPMEPLTPHPRSLGPLSLSEDADELSVRRVLDAALEELPFAHGVNNHMGSRLTQQPTHMRWLMETIVCKRNLYFVDSYTTERSVALAAARDHAVPAARRDVFLDHDLDPAAIEYQVQRLVRLARQRGHALAIGHPHDVTLNALHALPQLLQEHGIELVSPSELISSTPIESPVEAD
ncbi:MAG: divergent polysaccharide deacetylase family protein [Pseudomonadota bacterium]